MSKITKFYKDPGGSIVSKNILSGKGKLKWCFREKSMNAVDNGWRFLSDIDTDDFLNDPMNMSVCDYNTVANIEPAILAIYELPVGSEIELLYEGSKKVFIDCNTGEKLQY